MDTGAPVLRLEGISKRFGQLTANDAISLQLGRGEILGLLGENGAGKTTLMNILFGHYVADAGTIEVDGKTLTPGSPSAALAAGIGMVHQHFTLADNLTVLDNIVLGTESLFTLSSDRAAARARIAELGEAFGLAVDPDQQVGRLSVGERQRVEILKALYRKARILILDEPTAVLTPQESLALFRTLKRFAAEDLSIILISHKLGEVLAACGRVVVLRAGKVVAERATAGVSARELGEQMVGHAVAALKSEAMPTGRSVLRLRNISAQRHGHSIAGITLDLRRHDITGIAGVAGNGQSLLADVIAGMVTPTGGQVEINDAAIEEFSPGAMIAAGVARIPEDRHTEGVIGDMTITENVISGRYRSAAFSSRGLINWSKAREAAQAIIDSYAVKCPSADTPVRRLSGGNMQKLILGRELSGKPGVVLANQPTRGLDVGAIGFVHEQLLAAKRRGAAILLISEDLEELLGVCDRICVMYRGRLSEPVPRAEISLGELGLKMAGQGFADAA